MLWVRSKQACGRCSWTSRGPPSLNTPGKVYPADLPLPDPLRPTAPGSCSGHEKCLGEAELSAQTPKITLAASRSRESQR